MTRSPLAPALALLAVLLLSGCGGADVSAGAATPTVDLTSPESALAAVDSAERALDRALPPPPPVTVAVAATPPPPPPPPAAPPAPAAAAPPMAEAPRPPPPSPVSQGAFARGKDHTVQQEADSGGGACGTACSALASMERATSHLCEMTGPTDARCTGARERVKGAAARVHAACPACGG